MNSTLPPVAILAGGLATRLRPITATVPKSMLPVAGEPFVAHQLRLLARQGANEVVLCCGYLGNVIQEYVGNGSAFGLRVRYSFDGDKLKGTGGAIKQALPLLIDGLTDELTKDSGKEFIVIYGDSYLPTDHRAIYQSFRQSGKQALMTLFRNENLWDKSNVVFRDGRILLYDKRNQTPEMHHIDYGLGILNAKAFDSWQGTEVFDLAAVYEGLVQQGELAGYEVKERFYEIGSHEGLNETGALFEAIRAAEAGHPPRTAVSAATDLNRGGESA